MMILHFRISIYLQFNDDYCLLNNNLNMNCMSCMMYNDDKKRMNV